MSRADARGRPSGAKAQVDCVGSLRGLNPTPPSAKAHARAEAHGHFEAFAARINSCPDTKRVQDEILQNDGALSLLLFEDGGAFFVG